MEYSALELGKKIKDREIGCEEAATSILKTIEAVEPVVHAYSELVQESALNQARTVQKRLDSGEPLSPLAGVPMAVKDNICTKNITTSCGSKMLKGFKPPYHATVMERLENAGAVLLGKLNMDEFAMGGSTETSVYGPTANPWDISRVPGGSSGGSAAAVAAGEAFYALGSDTGGSIRQPCAFCGVSGIKPTYGLVSRYGLVAYASSLDQIGPVGKTIADCAAVLSLISGHDEKDSTSAKGQFFFDESTDLKDIKKYKIGVPVNYFGQGLENNIQDAVMAAAKTFESLGMSVESFELPEVDYAVPAYYMIACAEASSNLSRYDGVKYGYCSESAKSLPDTYVLSRTEGFGIEVKRRIMLGSFVLSAGYYDAYYKKALQVRGIIQQSFQDAFQQYDLILCPTTPTTAYKIGAHIADPLKMYLGDIYTVSVNLAGNPAATFPCGFDQKGLPIGLQLIGKPYGENDLIQAGRLFQQNTNYHMQRPEIAERGVQ